MAEIISEASLVLAFSISSRTLTGIISDVSEKNRPPSTVSDSEVIAGRMLGAGDVLQSIALCPKPWLM